MKIRGFLSQFSDSLDSVLRGVDGLLVGAAGLLAYSLHPGDWPLPPNYRIALLMAVLLTLLVFPALNVYRSWRGGGMLEEARRLAVACLMVMVALAFIAFASKYSAHYSRIWLFSWAGLCWVLLMAFRVLLRKLLRVLRRRKFNCKRVLVVGADEQGQKVSEHLRREDWTGLQVIGFIEDHEVPLAESFPPILGRIDEVAEISLRHNVDEVWIALPLCYETRVEQVLSDLRGSTVSIRFVPDLFGLRLLNSAMTEVGGMPVFDICVSRMDDGINRVLKYFEDRLLAALILVLISPLMLIIAIAIKFDSPGPVFFKQKRYGWGGKTIEVYKFRSMWVHSEAPGGTTQAKRNDPRVTSLGRLLRSSSLDELPQFINVLQGRMSIVGPRPHPLAQNEQFKDLVDWYMLRHKVKPGITGWAQVNGWRGETESLDKMEQRVKFDLFYIENWSLTFDLRIILLTLFKGFGGKNAY